MNRPIKELLKELDDWERFSIRDFERLDNMRHRISQEISTLDNMVNDIKHFIESTTDIPDEEKVTIFNMFHDILITRRDLKNKKSIIDPLMRYGNLKKRCENRNKDIPKANTRRTKELYNRAVYRVNNNYNYYTRVMKSTFGEVISKDSHYFNKEIKKILMKNNR